MRVNAVGVGGTGARFGVDVPDGEHDAVVLWNEDDVAKSSGAPKIVVTLAVGAAKLDYHAAIGTFSMENVQEVLAPETCASGGDIRDGALKGRACRVLIKHEEWN